MTQPNYTGRPRRLDDAEIVRLYVEEGQDAVSIGAAAGCSHTYVLERVREAGHQVRKRGGKRHSLKLTDVEICRRYLAGESGPDLAQAAQCEASSIYGVLERAGIPRRVDAATKAQGARKMAVKSPWRAGP